MIVPTADVPIHVIVDSGPTVADWVVAGTGVLAFVAALAAVIPTWRQLTVLLRNNERDQATKFGMWAESIDGEVTILYSNASAIPVYNVTAHVGIGSIVMIMKSPHCGPAAAPQKNKVITDKVRTEITQRLDREFGPVETNPNANRINRRYQLEGDIKVVKVSFRDAGGIDWSRDSDGKLTKTPKESSNFMVRVSKIRSWAKWGIG